MSERDDDREFNIKLTEEFCGIDRYGDEIEEDGDYMGISVDDETFAMILIMGTQGAEHIRPHLALTTCVMLEFSRNRAEGFLALLPLTPGEVSSVLDML